MFKNLINTIRNKRIQRLIKKTHLWQTTQIDFLNASVKQHFNSIRSIRAWLEEIEKNLNK
jgi:hypothetical protein